MLLNQSDTALLCLSYSSLESIGAILWVELGKIFEIWAIKVPLCFHPQKVFAGSSLQWVLTYTIQACRVGVSSRNIDSFCVHKSSFHVRSRLFSYPYLPQLLYMIDSLHTKLRFRITIWRSQAGMSLQSQFQCPKLHPKLLPQWMYSPHPCITDFSVSVLLHDLLHSSCIVYI